MRSLQIPRLRQLPFNYESDRLTALRVHLFESGSISASGRPLAILLSTELHTHQFLAISLRSDKLQASEVTIPRSAAGNAPESSL